MTEIALTEIATFVNGTISGVCEKVRGANSLDQATSHDLAFVDGPKHDEAARQSAAGVLVCQSPIEGSQATFLVVDHPRNAFAAILREFFVKKREATGIHHSAEFGAGAVIGSEPSIGAFVAIGAGTMIGDRVRIMPGVVIGEGCTIGDDVTLHANVSVRDGCELYNRVTIHDGTVIGSDGFGYVQNQGRNEKVPQLGNVVIEDDVEIGANTTIDRAAFGSTRIGAGTKIDNLVQIGHNVDIGNHSIVISQVGISGSSRIGSYCMLGGQVGVVGHIKITDRVMVGAQSGVAQDVTSPGVISGSPAIDHRMNLRNIAAASRIADMKKEIRGLAAEIERLKGPAGDA